jgi:hypothetical protein
MRLATVVFAVLIATMLASSEAAVAITTYSSSSHARQMVAVAIVPDRNSVPLYFSIRTGILGSDTVNSEAFEDGVYYQSTGAAEISIGEQTTALRPGDGMFLPAGTRFALKAQGEQPAPSTYLQFLLVPPSGVEPAQPVGASVEVYRSPSPIPALMPNRNLLSLSRVAVPPRAPCDSLHQRSGAALHYILAGVGAEFAENQAIARGPGSVSFEPHGLVYQWSNPDSKPLVYLVFNINPKDEPPVIAVDDHPEDPFSVNPHITWAIYCVALSIVLTLLVGAARTLDDDQKSDEHRRKR